MTYQNEPTEENKIKLKIIIIKKDKFTSARLLNRQESRGKPAQSYSEREDLPVLMFSLTAPCLPAIMDGGNSSGTKLETQEEGNLYSGLKRQKSSRPLDRYMVRDRQFPPTPTKHFRVPGSSWPVPEASRTSWVCRKMDRAGEVPSKLSSW